MRSPTQRAADSREAYDRRVDALPGLTVLTSVSGSFHAQVLKARLQSEGIEAQLRGALASTYGLTMGEMARVDVCVPDDQLDDARLVLLVDEVDATLGPPSEWWNSGVDVTPARWPAWVAGVLLGTAVVSPLLVYAHAF